MNSMRLDNDDISLNAPNQKDDFEKTWKQYIRMIIDNKNFIFSTSEREKLQFCELLHRQIETCNRMFLIASMADKKQFQDYFRSMNTSINLKTDIMSLAKSMSAVNSPAPNLKVTQNIFASSKPTDGRKKANIIKIKTKSLSLVDELSHSGLENSSNSIEENIFVQNKLDFEDQNRDSNFNCQQMNALHVTRDVTAKHMSFSQNVDSVSTELHHHKNTQRYYDSIQDIVNIEDKSKSGFMDGNRNHQNISKSGDSVNFFPNNSSDLDLFLAESRKQSPN